MLEIYFVVMSPGLISDISNDEALLHNIRDILYRDRWCVSSYCGHRGAQTQISSQHLSSLMVHAYL